MKIVSIVGARPEFVQVAVLSREIRHKHHEVLVHTGQHYDANMSDRFFAELAIPDPDYNLDVGSMNASAQCGEMMRRLDEVFAQEDPDLVIVRGDTNSTLAAALVARQRLLPLAHIEAGMRSYDRTAPEELNRTVADHISDFCLVTDRSAAERLAGEGLERGVYVCGDVMYDLYLIARERAAASLTPELRAATAQPYDLLTMHRTENTDDRRRLAALLEAFADPPRPVIFPVHPRTRGRLAEFGLEVPRGVLAVEPLSYLEIVEVERNARVIFTDSGGVQREAYFAGVPCVTLRDATEWTNTIDAGWNRLVGTSVQEIRRFLAAAPPRDLPRPPLFGAGDAAARIVAALEEPASLRTIEAARKIREARGAPVRRPLRSSSSD
jgi:UDP-N-acetylglucosamine 2-epimerase